MSLSNPKRAARCPDMDRAGGKGRCARFRDGGGCALPDHPACEEWVRVNPERPPDDPAARRALALAPERYLSGVRAGRWFASASWRSEGRKIKARPAHSAASFHRYPVRRCRTLHGCDLCGQDITAGQHYYDGGHGRRAHTGCAPAGMSGVAMIGVPTPEDVERAERDGLEVRLSFHRADADDVWLVPSYTDSKRNEVTWSHIRTTLMVAAFFPGSIVTKIGAANAAVDGELHVRCSCVPGEPSEDCPVGKAVGKHEPGIVAALTCSCDGSDGRSCEVGKAVGAGHRSGGGADTGIEGDGRLQ